MTLTKEDLINSVHNHLNLPRNRSAHLVESVLEIIKKTLASGEDVMICRFGKFYVLDKKERRGRNFQSGEDLMLGARRVVGFKCSGKLKERMNGEG